MSSIGSFIITKNEAEWWAGHLHSWLDYLDEMVIFDGNSTDGTLEIIKAVKRDHAFGYKIRLFENKDCDVNTDDYTKLFNECLRAVQSDWAFFLHPDMLLKSGGENLRKSAMHDGIAMYVHMESYAGEPGGQLYKITSGRMETWKSIYRLRPDFGAHYHGLYGAADEDVYFSAITGDEHIHYGHKLDEYPYEVRDSGCHVMHFSDVRPYGRRLGRMKTCLQNQGYTPDEVEKYAKDHPRVNFQPAMGFQFEKAEYPTDFLRAKEKYKGGVSV